MPARTANTALGPDGKVYRRRRGRGRVSPTGPYRAESGNAKVRSRATPAERRKLGSGEGRTARRVRRLAEKDRRIAAKAKRDAAQATKAVKKATASRPIETLRRAEAKLAKREDAKLREAARKLRHALAAEAVAKARQPTPEGSPRRENYPLKELEDVAPRARRKAKRIARGPHPSSEGLGEPEDLTTAITLAAPGGALGALGKRTATAAAKEAASAALGKAGAKAVESAAAKKAAGGAAKRLRLKAGSGVKAKAKRVKTFPKRTARKARTAPRRARRAVRTREGRRAAAKGAAKGAARRPVKSGVGAAAISPVPLPGEIDERARAFLKGEAAAALNHPGKYLETTTQAGLGMLTFPLALGAAGVKSVKSGSTKPLREEADVVVEGTKKMVEELASGDPKRVERSALQESGAIPFIPAPAILRRAKGTKAYEGARSAARASAEKKRAPKREARIKADRAAQEKGSYRSRRSQRKIERSQPVIDTETGQPYISRTLGRATEKQRSRHRIAREFARIKHEEGLARKGLEEVAKPLRRSGKTTQKDVADLGTALRIVGRYGLPRDEAKGLAFVARLHGNWPKAEHGKSPGGVTLDRHATEYILGHPEVFRNPKFWESVERLDKLQAEPGIATSPRHRFMAQVDQLVNPIRAEEGKAPLLKPEDMVTPEALKLLPKRKREVGEWSRAEAWGVVAELKRNPSGKAQTRAAALQKALEDAGGGRRLMRPTEQGGPAKGVSTTQAVPWTPEMLQRHLKQVKPELRRLGLREPTPYLADVLPSEVPGGQPRYGAGLPRAVHASRGIAAKSGDAIADFDQAMLHSVVAPRRRAAMVTGLNRIFDRFSRKVEGRRYLTHRQVEEAINTHRWPAGTVPVRTQMLRSLLEGDAPLGEVELRHALEAELEHGQALISGGAKELRKEIEASKAIAAPGEKFAPMDMVAINELMGHLEGPGAVTRAAGHATNAATRTILNSPAFEISQFFQEGIPGAVALGRDVAHIPKALKQIKQINALPLAEQNRIRAVMGASVGLRGAPDVRGTKGLLDPVRAAAPKQAWRHVWEIANGSKISRFDIARSGRFREVAALSRIEGDLARAEKGFQGWRHSARNLFKNEMRAVEDMKGMDGGERALYIAEHPRLGDNVVKDMRGILGNWDAFTVFEKHIAPFAIFYPFQRFSALWTLFHFPLDHPAAATSLVLLGAINASEVEKAAAREGGKPSILDYAKPVSGDTVLPSGQRFSAGLGAVQQALLEGEPVRALQGLTSAISLPVEALTGKSAFTGAPLGESGWEYLARAGAGLSPLLRFLGVPKLAGGEPSPASKAFAQQDPLRQERSFINPLIGQSTKQFGKEKRLEKDFDTKYGEGRIPGPFDSALVTELLYGNDGKPRPELLPEVLRKIHEAEAASNRVGRAEAPFLPKSGPFTDLQKELLEEVENAWQTGPDAGSGGGYGSQKKGSYASRAGSYARRRVGGYGSRSGGGYGSR